MAEREWQPGDVAIWARANGEGDLLIFRDGWGYSGDDAGRWISSDEGEAYLPKDAALRPLVVIDPEDREAASRFANLIENCGEDTHCATYPCGSLSCWADRVQQALREFANPTPPKPDEPTGLGAVVEDADGELWVRDKTTTTSAHWKRARGQMGGKRLPWSAIDAVRVLSEGIRP